MRFERKSKAVEKLNVIPILDAVFIFIFFLLMSAQFLNIHEIGSDAPAVSTIDPEKDKKPPLNLVLSINRSSIAIKTGLDGELFKTIGKKGDDYDYDLLNKTLVQIKQKHIDEESVILKPDSSVPYEDIIKIIDYSRDVKEKDKVVSGTNKKGEKVQTRDLFKQIIFETIM